MFHPRKIESHASWSDADGIKIYTISARHEPVDQVAYFARLNEVKKQRDVIWASTPAFVIFHDGVSFAYLVLAWWGNDNELFTSVSVHAGDGWIEDAARFSFCLYDLEVFWHERNYFVEFMDGAEPRLERYRAMRFGGN